MWPAGEVPVTSTSIPPSRWIGSDDAPATLDCRGRRESGLRPNWAISDVGASDIWAPVSITLRVGTVLVVLLSLLV